MRILNLRSSISILFSRLELAGSLKSPENHQTGKFNEGWSRSQKTEQSIKPMDLNKCNFPDKGGITRKKNFYSCCF